MTAKRKPQRLLLGLNRFVVAILLFSICFSLCGCNTDAPAFNNNAAAKGIEEETIGERQETEEATRSGEREQIGANVESETTTSDIAAEVPETVAQLKQINAQAPEEPHIHEWVGDICIGCGNLCGHLVHDENAICAECGMQVWHVYDLETNKCKICGHEWTMERSWMEEEWYLPIAEHKGDTQRFEIPTPNMGKLARKLIEVYIPYDYDPSRQYDVLMLFSGLQAPYNSFISDIKYDWRREQDKSIIMRNIWDNMIERGYCKPMIICSISTYTLDSYVLRNRPDYNEQTDFEGEGQLDKYWYLEDTVRDYVFPFLIENFSTYANSTDPKDIEAARRHFCIGGFSNGGYFTVYSAMTGLYNYVSSFLPIAGSHSGHGAGNALHENWEQYPTDLVYFGCGLADDKAYQKTRKDYKGLQESCEELVEGVNLRWDSPPDFGHDWDTGSTVLFNAVQLLFCWNDDVGTIT